MEIKIKENAPILDCVDKEWLEKLVASLEVSCSCQERCNNDKMPCTEPNGKCCK